MKIEVGDLRKLCDILLSHVESKGISEIQLEQDYYWNISADQRYNPYVEPNALTLGQLEADWTELQKVTNGDLAIINYHLVWLSTILRAVGEIPE